MKKLSVLLLAAVSATSALAGEVGAQNPQFASAIPASLAIAIVDTGVSTSWTSTPDRQKALAETMNNLEDLNDQIGNQVSEDLEQRIAEKLELTFAR